MRGTNGIHDHFRKGDVEILKWKQQPKNAQLTSLGLIYGRGMSDVIYIRGGFNTEIERNNREL